MRNWGNSAWRTLRRAALGLTALVTAAGALAQASIESVTGSIQGGSEVVRIDLSEPLKAVPEGFVGEAGARARCAGSSMAPLTRVPRSSAP